MDTPITRAEHEEFRRRLEEENRRQDKRIELLEESTRQIAISIEGMVKEQEVQGARLEALEGRDGKMWRAAVSYTITAVIGVVIGFIFNQLGM